MLQVSPFTRILVALIVLGGILVALPNALPDKVTSRFPSWLPHNTVSLGLDLQGGSSLLLEVDFAQVQRDKAQATIGDIRSGLRKAHIQYLDLGATGDTVQVRVPDAAAQVQARSVLDGINPVLSGGSVLAVGGVKNMTSLPSRAVFSP